MHMVPQSKLHSGRHLLFEQVVDSGCIVAVHCEVCIVCLCHLPSALAEDCQSASLVSSKRKFHAYNSNQESGWQGPSLSETLLMLR